MDSVSSVNVQGTDYTVIGSRLIGTCSSSAGAANKEVTLVSSEEMLPGICISVKFTNANTYGNVTPQTIYSSDGKTFYSDSAMTKAITLAPATNRFLKYTGTGSAYTYYYFPTITIGDYANIPLCDSRGHKISGSMWAAGDKITLFYDGEDALIQNAAVSAVTSITNDPVNSTAINGALANYQGIEALSNGTYTIADFATLLLNKTTNLKTKKFIFQNGYATRVGISDFLGGSDNYDFICGDVTFNKYSDTQYSILFNVNTYYIGTTRYFKNLLVEYSITQSGQAIWTNYATSSDLTGALAEYGKDLLTGVSWESGYLTGAEDVTESPLGTQSTTQLEITSEAITVSTGTYRLSLFATKSSNYAFWLGVGEYLSDGTHSARPTLSDLSARSLIYEFVIPSTITQIKISYRSYDNILCKLEKIK